MNIKTLTSAALFAGATLLTGMLAQSAQAAIITNGCANSGFCTFQELVNGGSFTVTDPLNPGPSLTVGGFSVIQDTRGLDLNSFLVSGTSVPGPGTGLAGFYLDFTPTGLNAGTNPLPPTANFTYNYNITGNGFSVNSAEFEFRNYTGTSGITGLKALAGGTLPTLNIDIAATNPDSTTFAPRTTLAVGDDITLTSTGSDISLSGFRQTFGVQSTPEPGTVLSLLVFGAMGAGSAIKRKLNKK